MYKKEKDKNRISLFWGQLILTFIGLAMLAIILFPLIKNINKQYAVNREIKDLQREISSLEKNNQDLLKLIDFMESDQFVIEQARLKLNYKKEGEDVVIIKSKEDVIKEKMSMFESNEKNENLTNPQRWLRYFIKPKI